MVNCHTIPIDERYNREMLSILKASPVKANGLSLYFDKSPDLFTIPRLKYSRSEHLGFFMDGKLKGFGSLGYYDARVNGRPENVFSFYNFYLLPEARGHHISTLAMKEFFDQVKKNSSNFGIAITLKGNRPAESYIGRRPDEWMPPSRVIDELVVKTILFSKPKKNNTGYQVRNAVPEDIPALVELLNEEHRQRDFGLIYREDKFLPVLQERGLKIEDYYVVTDRRGAIKGVCLAWDCGSFRRTRVLRYAPGFFPYVAGYKTLEKIFAMAPLPPKGESFHELTITDYAVSGRDPLLMHALLSEIYFRNHNRNYHFMNWASCGSDPLLRAAKGFWQKDITSHIIFTSMDPEFYEIKTRLPYIDIAFI